MLISFKSHVKDFFDLYILYQRRAPKKNPKEEHPEPPLKNKRTPFGAKALVVLVIEGFLYQLYTSDT